MRRRGSAMIEMALVMILFAALVSGGFRAVRSMTSIHEMESAVRAGAMAAARHPNPDLSDPRFRAAVLAEVIEVAPHLRAADVLIEAGTGDGPVREVKVSIRGYRHSASYPWMGPRASAPAR